ncbi:hypothetical protein TSAR_015439, partial [Trichomalopsis sarcophagae]
APDNANERNKWLGFKITPTASINVKLLRPRLNPEELPYEHDKCLEPPRKVIKLCDKETHKASTSATSTSASIHEAIDIHCDSSTVVADASNVVENKEDSFIENILEIQILPEIVRNGMLSFDEVSVITSIEVW